jgi:peptidoglycan/LPS O-acetylase OafA/YrhL
VGAPDLPAAEGADKSQYSRDIQGLRAVAVILVVLDHAGVRGLSGGFVGVDVFFVISGFLITRLIVRGAMRDQHVSFGQFYARRVRRIAPAATLTIVGTMIASKLVLNYVRAGSVFHDAVWSTFFAANIRFARNGTNYFSPVAQPSPYQHFWSLAVEEQFYVVWPALIATALFVGLRRRSRLRYAPANEGLRPSAGRPGVNARLVVLVVMVTAASLVWSIYETPHAPNASYFSTFTRAWELGFGAVLAVLEAQFRRLPGWLLATAGWAGLGAIAFSSHVFSASTQFPGSAAVVPVLGAVGVIASSIGKQRFGPALLLSQAPLRLIGNWSYSFYLFHWPILVLVAAYSGHPLTVDRNLVLLAIALALSAISYYAVEEPFRKWQAFGLPANALVFENACVVTALILALFVNASATSEAVRAEVPIPIQDASAKAPSPDQRSVNAAVQVVAAAATAAIKGAHIPAALNPAPADIGADHETLGNCIASTGQTASAICNLGDPKGKHSLVVIGDSHALQWVPALEAIGRNIGWRVYPLVKLSCTSAQVTLDVPGTGPNRECDTWRGWAFRKAAALDPTVAIISTRVATGILQGGEDLTGEGLVNAWEAGMVSSIKKLQSDGARVDVFSDTPIQRVDPTECLLSRHATMKTCTTAFGPYVAMLNNANLEAAVDTGAAYIDVDRYLCSPSGECPTVIGHTVAYYDANHISEAYAEELAPDIQASLKLRRVASSS